MVSSHRLLIVAVVGLGLGMQLGCDSKGKGASTGAEEIKTSAEFKPGVLFSPDITLSMSDTELAAKMKASDVGENVSFAILVHGIEIDTEKYRLNQDSFSLVEMVESYQPPIKLIGFPMSISDSWEWSGVQTSASIERKASAKITSSLDKLYLEGVGGLETVKISVALEVESGVAKPRESKLEFWFAPGKGIVKRAYGNAIVRRPANMKAPKSDDSE